MIKRAPHAEVSGLFDILAGVHSLVHDDALEEDLKRRASAIEEGWQPWQGVWVRTREGNAEVAVWATPAAEDRIQDDDRMWIEKKFRQCVEHLEYFLGPAEMGRGTPSPVIWKLDDGEPACARWDHDVARFFVYLEHEDTDLPIVLFVRAERVD